MAISIEIKQEEGINLEKFKLLSEEFFGTTVLYKPQKSVSILFESNANGKNFCKMIAPFFASGIKT